jgi:pilus assembly protein CpaB
MNRSRLLMIGALALAIGFLVSISVYKNLKNASGTKDAGLEVMVAANDLQVGTKVDEHDVKIIRVPSDAFPPGAPRRKADVIGHGVIQPISKGEFILPNHLAQENAGNGLPSLIPPGMRAVSVKVNEVVSVAGFVLPGTRVDVLLTGTPNGQGDEQTTTVLQNVAVLASGHTLERSPNGEAQTTAVITLLVTPDDAQRLTLASSSNGHIQLALRNPLDTRQEDVPPANSRALYKLAAPAPTPARVVPVHHVRPVIKDTPPPPQPVQVEVYQGDKKQDVKFPEEGPSTK